MEVLNRAAIKAEAKNFIGRDRRWLSMALACLPLVLLEGAVSVTVSVVNGLMEDGDLYTQYSAGTNIFSWLLIPFTVATAGYYLNYLRGFNPEWKSLYREGFDRYGKYFAVGFVTQLIIGLWGLLLVVPGIVKAYEYYFVNEIIHDNPNLSPKQARELSNCITYGFKGDLFVLDLSFYLWYVLVAFTFGIAAFYVGPYVRCTNAMCYENLKNYAISTGRARPEEFGIYPVPPYGADGAQAPFAPANPYDANAYAYGANLYDMGAQQTYAPTYGVSQPPYTQPPYAQSQAPFAAGHGMSERAPAEPPFTPPAPESTFVPDEESAKNTDSENANTENQDY